MAKFENFLLKNVAISWFLCFTLGTDLGFSDGRGLNFRKGTNQHKTKKK